MSERAPVLEMRGIRKAFPGVVALDGVDFTLQAGDVHMLLGENGAGKSTLMKILSGAYGKDAGEIRINGRPVTISSPGDALALGIRVIYQELNLVAQLSVAENIFLGAAPTRWGGVVDWQTLYDNTSRLLADLGMTLDPRAAVSRLGLAQRQMVEIAKALNNVGPLKTVEAGLPPSHDAPENRRPASAKATAVRRSFSEGGRPFPTETLDKLRHYTSVKTGLEFHATRQLDLTR